MIDKKHVNENNTNVGYHIPKGNMKFDRTAFDVGNKMNITSGVYSAPKDGVYLFGMDGHKCSGNAKAQVVVYHNGKEIKSVDHSDEKAQSTQITSFWTFFFIRLRAGVIRSWYDFSYVCNSVFALYDIKHWKGTQIRTKTIPNR